MKIEQIRPRVEHLSEERSAAMLASVLSSSPAPAPAAAPRRRRPARIVAATALLAVATGGAAYATGHVPAFVSDRFDQLTSGDDGWSDPIGEPYVVAEVELGNGDVARVWHASTTDGSVRPGT